MHVPNKPMPGALRQLPDSMMTSGVGAVVGAGTGTGSVGAGDGGNAKSVETSSETVIEPSEGITLPV